MTAYPGNTSLSSAVKDRVTATFQQTLALYRQGRTDEVVAGCNLLLQMDPLFDPAKKLLEKARNPASPIEVESLLPVDTKGPLNEARQALAKRDFERVIQITTGILTNDLMNDDARVLADEAREKLEAGPFIDQFVKKCEQHVANGNMPAARNDLEKARALDAGHPGLQRIQQLISQKESAAPAVDASTFVVDSPAAGQGGAAQASDFGFTFEEDKGQPQSFANFSFDSPAQPAAPQQPGGFSFDAPASPAPASPSFSFDAPADRGAAAEFDFSSASIETTPDDQKKIDQYLTDGDRSFEAGDYQGAVDLWSRIFLIDVTNDAASERIERAKGKRREAEQKVDGVLAAAIQAFERRDAATARAKFEEVLQLDPTNASAQDYLERLRSGEAPAEAFAPSAPSKAQSVFDDDEALGAPLTPPAPTAARKAPTAKPAAAPAARKRLPMGLIALVLAAVVLVGGGWFAWKKFMSGPSTDPAATSAVLSDATRLGQLGRYDEAIAKLQEIKPGDPQYDSALQMIGDLQQKKSKAPASVDGKPAAQYYEENLAAGQAAMQARDFVAAKKAFDNAQTVKPLPPDVKAAYDAAARQVGKLDVARQLFGERRYQEAVAALEPLLEQDPRNRSIQKMLTDAHFNSGATALQQEKMEDAIREFDRVLEDDPQNELAKRSKELAQRYQGQPTDLLYKIYVKYLPLRQPDA